MRRATLIAVAILACWGVLALSAAAARAAQHAVTGAASGVQATSATLNGIVEANGKPAAYHFDYGSTTAYGEETAAVALPPSTEPAPATSEVLALTPNTTYHFRLVVAIENTNKETIKTLLGGDASFTTPGPPQITGEPGEGLSHSEQIIRAQVNPEQLETTYRVEYGPTTAYGTSAPGAGPIPPGTTPVAVEATLKGLQLGGTYHYRVVAVNAAGTTFGADEEFTSLLIDGESVTEVGATSATLSAQIDPAGMPTTYHFEYGESTAYGTSTPVPDTTLGAGVGYRTVSQPVQDLRSGTTYHYRVVATVEGVSAAGVDRTFATPGEAGPPPLPDGRSYEMVSPPQKHGAYVLPIELAGVTIQAAEDGGSLAYSVEGALVEGAEGNRSPYAQQALATRSPDGWSSQELVTPQDRTIGAHGGPEYLLFSSNLSLGLLQGDYRQGQTPLAEPPLSPPVSEAEQAHCPGSPEGSPKCQEKTIYLRENAPIAPGATQSGIYEHAKRNGEMLAAEHGETAAMPGYLPLVTAANVPAGTKFGGFQQEGRQVVTTQILPIDASADLSHMIIEGEKVSLTPGAPSEPNQLYEWSPDESISGGSLQLVSLLPGNVPITQHKPELGYNRGTRTQDVNHRHAISDDGSRIVWTSGESGDPGFAELGHLYLRDTKRQETLQLDLPEEKGPVESEPGRALFQTASSDGSKIFFTDSQRLTKDSSGAPTQGLEQARRDLYVCEVIEVAGKLACTLRDLTADQNPGEAAAVVGYVFGAAEDGSDVYFVADGVLANGAVPGDCRSFIAQAKPPPRGTSCSLYVAQHGAGGWSTRFVARLSSEDAPDFYSPNDEVHILIDKPVRVSPNGRYVAFMSNRSLTGYDNTDVNEIEGEPGEGTRHADEEVFLYDAERSALRCVSCDPSGARPRGVYDTKFAEEGVNLVIDGPGTWGRVGVDHWLAGDVPGWTGVTNIEARYQSRYLSDSGRLFFNSAAAIVPAAVGATRKEKIKPGVGPPEATVGAANVYQYEPGGVGNCAQESGCVSLLSGGTSHKESAFLDASANGNDVFFLTDAKLLPQDVDAERDIYDARVCGEAGCLAPVQPAGEGCTDASSCKGGSVPAPTFQAPPSTLLAGSGNLLATAPKSGALAEKKVVKPLTRKQKLARALKRCRKLAHRTRAQMHRRIQCEALARHRYGPRKAKHSTKHGKGKGR